MSSYPLISVVIPTFNMAEFLPSCLSTIMKQDYPNLEVIIIDGLSTDSTLEVINRYDKIVSVYISEKDKGQPDAVTKGLQMAKGDIVHWHAADDIVMPGAFHRVSNEFKANPRLDLVFSDGLAFDEVALYRHSTVRWVNFWDALLFFGRFQSDCAYWKHSITPNALPLDFDKHMTCDEDFFLRLWVGKNFKWIPQNLGAFRSHGNQVSQRISKATVEPERAHTRSRICHEQGWSPEMLATMRRKRCLMYKIRDTIGVKIYTACRYAGRKVTFDIARKQYSLWFINEWIKPLY